MEHFTANGIKLTDLTPGMILKSDVGKIHKIKKVEILFDGGGWCEVDNGLRSIGCYQFHHFTAEPEAI
jgi:hypothetical protein